MIVKGMNSTLIRRLKGSCWYILGSSQVWSAIMMRSDEYEADDERKCCSWQDS